MLYCIHVYDLNFSISTLGQSEKVLSKFIQCTLDKCSPIGLESLEYPARGVFAVSTHSGSPYCCKEILIPTNYSQVHIILESAIKSCIFSFFFIYNYSYWSESNGVHAKTKIFAKGKRKGRVSKNFQVLSSKLKI